MSNTKKQTWKDGQQKGPKVTPVTATGPQPQADLSRGPRRPAPLLPASCLQDAALVRVTWHGSPLLLLDRGEAESTSHFLHQHSKTPSRALWREGDPGLWRC